MKEKQRIRLAEVYNSLSDKQRQAFWNSAINIFLVIFTFWLGLTVQYIVADSNQVYNEKLLRFEYRDKIENDKYRLSKALSLLENSTYPNADMQLVMNYELFCSALNDYLTITDSILLIFNDLKWNVTSQREMKTMDSDIKEIIFHQLKARLITSSPIDRDSVFDNYISYAKKYNIHFHFTYESIKENVEKFDKMQSYEKELALAKTCNEITGKLSDVSKIIGPSISEYSSNDFYNFVCDLSPLVKSVFLLILFLGLSIPISAIILRRMHVPTTERGFTKDEYESMQKEKDDRYGALKDKYDDLYGRFLKVLDELSEAKCNND